MRMIYSKNYPLANTNAMCYMILFQQEKQQSCGNLKSFLIVHLQFSM